MSPTPADDRLIPIVLGVVGHRDIHPDAVDKLRQSLNDLFAEFERAYPHSPLVALTPLAPGADQLVARVALDRPGRRWAVRAPLAFDPEVFLQSTSYQDATGRPLATAQAEFRALVADDRVDWFVVPVPEETQKKVNDTGMSLADIAAKRPGESSEAAALRGTFYANSGGYIVRHCHTLIALWDERHSDRPSGTHESVRFKLGGLSLTLYPWTHHEPLGFDGDRGPVVTLFTPRADHPEQVGRAGERTVRVPAGRDDQYGLYYGRVEAVPRVARRFSAVGRLLARVRRAWGERSAGSPGGWHSRAADAVVRAVGGPGRTEYDQFLTVCQAIDDYNAEAAALPPAAAVPAELFPPGEGGPTTQYKLGLADWFRRLSAVRDTAAQLSRRLTPLSNWTPWVASGWLFAALAVLHFYAHPPTHLDHHTPPDHPLWLLGVFFGLWAALGVAVCGLWLFRTEERRVDYRSMAEALRTRQAWAAAGVGRSVSDAYLGQLRGELVWVRRALQHLCPPPPYWAEQFDALPPPRQTARLEWVEKKWVRGQLAQHHKRSHDHHRNGRRLRRAGFVTFVVGLAVLATPFVLPADAKKPAEEEVKTAEWLGSRSHPPLAVLCFGGLLVVLGGVLVAVCEKLGHEALARQYEQIYAVFRGGARELEVILRPSLLARLRGCVPDAPPFPADPTAPAEPGVDVARGRRVIEHLGREAVQESAQWLVVRRSKPLELPLGA